MHPTPAVGGEPRERRSAADPGARGPRPRLVRGSRRLDRRHRRRRVLRRSALRAAARQRRPLLRRQRHRARLRPRTRAGRDGGQAAGAAAAAGGVKRLQPRSRRARARNRAPHATVQLDVLRRDRCGRATMRRACLRRERALERLAKLARCWTRARARGHTALPRARSPGPSASRCGACTRPRRPARLDAPERARCSRPRPAGSRRSRRRRCRAARS